MRLPKTKLAAEKQRAEDTGKVFRLGKGRFFAEAGVSFFCGFVVGEGPGFARCWSETGATRRW